MAVLGWKSMLVGTFIVVHPYKAKSKLLPSGLLGPIMLVAETTR